MLRARARVCVCVCVCVRAWVSTISGQTAGPIMTKFGMHMWIDLGMVPSTNLVKASKSLDRSGLNLARACRYIWKWTSATQI